MDTVIDGLIVIDSEGEIRAFNPAAERIFGYRIDEVIGQNVGMLMPEPYCSGHDQYLDSSRETGAAKIIGSGREVAGRRRDGSVFPMELGVNRLQIGDALMFVGTIRDITERKDAEERARTEAARTQAVMDTVLDGLITIDETGVIETFNPAAVRIFGYQPEEVIGRNVSMLMPEPYRAEHGGYLRNYMRTGAATVLGAVREMRAMRKGGSEFPMELGVSEMNVAGKRLFVGTVRDISERKQAEAAIEAYIAALSRSNQELDDFAYIASHDLKEPLRGLSNNALFLKEDFEAALGESGVRRLSRITYLCERMERLVNDLLYFSRLGRQALALQETDLNDVIADIALTLEHTLEEAHATIVVPAPLPRIVCDLPRITEVFRNLITNAVKYNDKPDKRIEIGCSERDGKRAYFVRDNGIGIERRFHQDIFRIFKRLNYEDDKAKGTGVGLTFVKKIVERHGGEIWLDSEPGQGTTFYFSIQSPQEA
ncbi:MAG TPA: PAS domain S-box protein [Acetobacteraceae bacterium]|nr:PAS domain S-box protein [Acetobacteraceae bacterium]